MLSAISRRFRPRPECADGGPQRRWPDAVVLLPVVFQHLVASRGQLGTILLKAGQDGQIALIYHRATEALNIARASLLLLRGAATLLLLGIGRGGNRQRQQGKASGVMADYSAAFRIANGRKTCFNRSSYTACQSSPSITHSPLRARA